MKHQSNILALKYRPSNFQDLIGQEYLVETIQKSIEQNKIPNAYIFTGIRGVGKTTTARIVAKMLNCTVFDKNNNPDLKILFDATSDIGTIISKNDIVIYESTVYPGCTEEDCVPILENKSKLKFNEDFYCGYSPERINPGDKDKTLTRMITPLKED